jgi:hypothetical protein
MLKKRHLTKLLTTFPSLAGMSPCIPLVLVAKGVDGLNIYAVCMGKNKEK